MLADENVNIFNNAIRNIRLLQPICTNFNDYDIKQCKITYRKKYRIFQVPDFNKFG